MEERILFSQKTTIFVPVDNDSRIKPMSKDSLCAQHTDCSGCPKAMESTLIHRNLLRGQHIPKDKCTQNCMLFMIKGELLINSEEYPGNILREKQFILQAIGSKIELLALTDVEYIVYWFNELPLLCEERYREITEQAEAPLTYTPLIMSERLHHLITSMPEFLGEESLNYLKLQKDKNENIRLYELDAFSFMMMDLDEMEKKIHSTPNDKKGQAGEPTITAGMIQ